jgi:membrane-associated phospholipid phosphatase
MDWLQSLDVELFRFINAKLVNPFFDVLMPFVSGNAFFYPIVLLAGLLLLWKGGARGRLCVLVLALVIPLGDSFVCNTIKKAVARPRPFLTLPDVRRPGTKAASPDMAYVAPSKDGSRSMPSSHAANWFAATMVAFVYFRRSAWFMLPMAALVGISRIYNGVHYPSDVLAGAILGAGYAAASVWSLETLWRWAGRKWFPLWWQRVPSLVCPERGATRTGDEQSEELLEPSNELRSLPPHPNPLPKGEGGLSPAHLQTRGPRFADAPRDAFPLPEGEGQGLSRHSVPASADEGETGVRVPHVDLDQHWLRLGYLLIAVLLLARLVYIAGGTIELTGDEAYQWLWSKHLALSYYSKPPLIAYTQFLGTAIWGDTELGVRFFSPVCTAILSLVLLRFFAREINARAGFFLLLIATATPLAAAGAVLMTVDPLSVLFWAAAMLTGWRAVQPDAKSSHWLCVGLWMGMGFLSKYTEVLQWLSWAVFFALWPPARKHLRKPGPYLALLVNVICAVPVLVWNSQHHWITVSHVADNAKVGEPWKPTLKYLFDFLASESLALNPVFFAGMIWAAIAFWRRGRHNPRLAYFFSMGAPLFLVYALYTLHSRVQPNWIAPSVLPLFCLMVAYWDTRWRLGAARLRWALVAGLGLGLPVVIVAHNTDLAGKFTGHDLPVHLDPLHRARGWKEVGRLAGEARQRLLTEGKPVFIITSHYRFVGEISFYLPEARMGDRDSPLVYYVSSPIPDNQFYFWPGYKERKGQNAVFVLELDRDHLAPMPPPAVLTEEFESVTDMGVQTVSRHGQIVWPIQLFACRGLR